MSAVLGVDERTSVAELVSREARLLDEARFSEWLDVYSDDATYWVPSGLPPYDHRRKVSIVYDDRAAMTRRVERLTSKFAYAQTPPSRTIRALSNVEVGAGGDESFNLQCVYVIYEIRAHRERTLPARAYYEIVDTGALRIAHKRLELLASDEPLEEIGFIL